MFLLALSCQSCKWETAFTKKSSKIAEAILIPLPPLSLYHQIAWKSYSSLHNMLHITEKKEKPPNPGILKLNFAYKKNFLAWKFFFSQASDCKL